MHLRWCFRQFLQHQQHLRLAPPVKNRRSGGWCNHSWGWCRWYSGGLQWSWSRSGSADVGAEWEKWWISQQSSGMAPAADNHLHHHPLCLATTSPPTTDCYLAAPGCYHLTHQGSKGRTCRKTHTHAGAQIDNTHLSLTDILMLSVVLET